MQKYTKFAIFLAISTGIATTSIFANGLLKLPRIPHPDSANYNLKLPPFSALQVRGPVDVHVITSPSFQSSSYVIEGPHQRWVSAIRKNHMLVLRASTHNGSRSSVTVKMPEINFLSVSGSAQVSSRNVRSDGLTIRDAGYGYIHLTGMVDLHKIVNLGNGYVDVSWVNSRNFTLSGFGQSYTRVAGISKNLYARLYGHAGLDATYLRAQNVFVSTQDYANAKVLPIQRLHAFANNQSNIYYYKYPRTKNLSTQEIGNVLQLGWHN
jgi:hypothetical protein